MIEVKNRLYIQRFLATELKFSDLWKAVTYSQLELKEGGIPFWYVKSKGYTATTDLKRTWEEIYSDMKSNTRNEVRRAQKEGIIIESNFDYDKFVPFYNDFCDSKGLDLKITKHTLEKYDKMLITVARKGDNVLAMHATVINPKDKVAMLFYSCSQRLSEDVDRKLIGWANRYLHYRELEIFKEQGYERYEWHSLVIDPAHPNYSIGQFKLSFGGALHETVSAKTPLFVLMKKAQSFLFRIQRLFPSARNIFKRIMNKFLWLFCATRINSTGKTIYLTFDDGPEPGITEFVLDELNKYGFKATFFCRGDNAQKYPNLLAMINGGGYSVANHTFSHILSFNTDCRKYIEDVQKCDITLKTNLFRPPYGSLTLKSWMKLRKKYQIILWSINSGDSMMESFDVDRSMNTLKKQTKPGDIVLFHFCHKHEKETRKLLPVYLQWLKDNGYKSQSIV